MIYFRQFRLAVLILVVIGTTSWAAPFGSGADPRRCDFRDTFFLPRTLDEFGEPCAVVVVFSELGDPESDAALELLNGLERRYRNAQVSFLNLNMCDEDALLDVALDAMRRKLGFPAGKDTEHCLQSAFGVRNPGDTVLLDGAYTPVYVGPASSLLSPLLALIGGASLETSAASPVLAALEPEESAAGAPVTYTQDIAPLVARNCLACHSQGGVAPMTFETYTDLASHSAMVAEVVSEGRMPPWFAHGGDVHFLNDPELSDAERLKFRAWHEQGKPEGPPADVLEAAAATPFTPDIRLSASKPYQLPGSGFIDYADVELPFTAMDDVWIQGVAIMPSNPRVMHHAALLMTGDAASADERQNVIAFAAPGMPPFQYPEGTAVRWRKGVRLSLRMHYVTTGKPEEDLISVGLIFPRTPVHKEVHNIPFSKRDITIPPGSPRQEFSMEWTSTRDLDVLALTTHMHLRGESAYIAARLPDGELMNLLVVPAWNFNWQNLYYVKPGTVLLPAGTVIGLTGVFDNSSMNPYNPAPAKEVRHGAQVTDEMLEGLVVAVHPDEVVDVTLSIDEQLRRIQRDPVTVEQ